jgi:glycosidase
MPWDPSPTAGFTTGTPWLPIVDATARNVADQSADPSSLLSLYRHLIAARRSTPALGRGDHRSLFDVAPGVMAWLREADGDRVLCLLNVDDGPRHCRLPSARLGSRAGAVLVATSTRTGIVELDDLVLEPLEGIALRLD